MVETTPALCPIHGLQLVEFSVFTSGSVGYGALCPRCADLENRRIARALKWETVCPPLYRETSLDRLPISTSTLSDVLSWRFGPRGLILAGPTGGGKTRLAYYLLRREGLLQDRGICAADATSLGWEISRAAFDNESGSVLSRYSETDLLLVDDLGKGTPTPSRLEALFSLVERRISHGRPLLVTTNYLGDDLEARLSSVEGCKETSVPLLRRLREFCRVVIVRPQEASGP